jgi:hypothetical protein
VHRGEAVEQALLPAESASYAAYMLVNSVSPPCGGVTRAWIAVASGGSARNDMSECQPLPMLIRNSSFLSTIMTSA